MNQEHLERLVEFIKTLESQSSWDIITTSKELEDYDPDLLTFVLTGRCYLRENLPNLTKLLCEALRIYSYKQNVLNRTHLSASILSPFSATLVKLIKTEPLESFTKVVGAQMLGYMMNMVQHRDVNAATSLYSHYLAELKNAFLNLSHDDKHLIRPTYLPEVITRINFRGKMYRDKKQYVYQDDASFIINFATIETVKHCISVKLKPDYLNIEFLGMISRLVNDSMFTGDKMSCRMTVNLVQHVDRFLLDRTSDASTDKNTFRPSEDADVFMKKNASSIQAYFLRRRYAIARLAIAVDDPAECWRNISISLSNDLYTEYQGINRAVGAPPSAPLIMRQESSTWMRNLELLVIAAKQLGDSTTLEGLRFMIERRALILSYPPLQLITSNIDHSYEFVNEFTQQSDLPHYDMNLIERLDAKIELDQFRKVKPDLVYQLQSDNLRNLYELYYDSLHTKYPLAKGVGRYQLEQVVHSLKKWQPLSGADSRGTHMQPLQTLMDLAIPACLNIISKTPWDERPWLIEQTESILGRDFSHQCAFGSAYINPKVKVFNVILDLLRDNDLDIPDAIFNRHKNDLLWCHHMQRMLHNTFLLRRHHIDGEKLDHIFLNAAKFHWRHNNLKRAGRLAISIKHQAHLESTKFIGSMILADMEADPFKKYEAIRKIASEIRDRLELDDSTKCNLALKLLRHLVKEHELADNCDKHLLEAVASKPEQRESINSPWQHVRWAYFLGASTLESQAKTLAAFSNRIHDHLAQVPGEKQLLNLAFSLDMKLLVVLGQIGAKIPKYEGLAVKCAIRLLEKITRHFVAIDSTNFREFSEPVFVNQSIEVWTVIKSTLISVITYETNIPDKWYRNLINIMKRMCHVSPYILLYNVIVNKLDLKNEVSLINREPGHDQGGNLLLHAGVMSDTGDSPRQSPVQHLDRCKRLLVFWDILYEEIKTIEVSPPDWPAVMHETEKFLLETRKISYLRAEYLKELTQRIPKKFQGFIESLKKSTDPWTKLSQEEKEEFEHRLTCVCNQSLDSINILLNYEDRVSDRTKLTLHDGWFKKTFRLLLTDLRHKISELALKRTLAIKNLDTAVRSITENLSVCRLRLHEYNRQWSQSLCMEVISPVLSRMAHSIVPLPDCCDLRDPPRTKVVTIHKVHQRINLIASKTSPKKITLVGSDGISRSYILKAHEDLRLDQMVMEFYGSINKLLASSKITRNRYSVHRYVVTPVSFRSGLIQWVDAPSILNSYRSWLNSAQGKKLVAHVYEDTCRFLCGDDYHLPKAEHTLCQPPEHVQANDLFYQILWASTKPTHNEVAQVKPHYGNISKYREAFSPLTFEEILQQMYTLVPDELIANELWYNSLNAQEMWQKTREFIDSSTVNSILGYIIGLGDRHPENILVDYKTGKVIHIDYNICFEMGKNLSIPERVPFRLTPNILRAFGFLGLEGGFTKAFKELMNFFVANRSTLLNLLDPINFGFMTGPEDPQRRLRPSRQSSSEDRNHSHQIMGVPSSHILTQTLASLDRKMCKLRYVLSDELERLSRGVADKPPEKNPTDDICADLRSAQLAVPAESRHPPSPAYPQTNLMAQAVTQEVSLQPRSGSPVATSGQLDSPPRLEVPVQPEAPTRQDIPTHPDTLAPPNGPSLPNEAPVTKIPVREEAGSGLSGRMPRGPRSALPPKPIELSTPDTQEGPEVFIPSFEFEHNIKTPTKISQVDASQIHKRISDKLSGVDSDLHKYLQAAPISQRHSVTGAVPTAQVECTHPNMTPDFQVEALITEALSDHQKAAMFEGWAPWI